jgi:ribosomal protein S18 acetylase RimI-like enzyme
VSAVVLECYGHRLQGYRFDRAENWPDSWIAEAAGDIVAVMLTGEDWVDDLWIAPPHRTLGLGTALLRIGEDEIANRGYTLARLRVPAENSRALRFYAGRGWTEAKRYSHEVNGFEMVEMVKHVGQAHG